ncbi:MAG TPA: hypothetical protein DHV42_08280 [Lachnospiraceae bacterium]|nr:hypothetical protein [Lachnospiraceae bacterium]
MNITSMQFVVFCTLLTILYYVLPGSIQWILLLVFSLFFYTRAGYPALAFLLVTAVAAFGTALWMERENERARALAAACGDRAGKAACREASRKKKKRVFILMCILTFGIWIVTKYSGMLLDTFAPILPAGTAGTARTFLDRMIVPLGISFYTFTCAGYVIDVSRKKYMAEKNPLKFLLYVSFFPHIIQGPFSRFDRLGKTLFVPHRFDWERMSQGLGRVVYGYCQKLLVADKLAPTISTILANPSATPGVYLFFTILGYGIQLYADFAGYMNIMCGLCQVLGIELEENFRQPYFAVSIQNYWKRWHITLGNWYSDYVFYPASMGKTAQKIGRMARERFGARMGKLLPSYFAMVFVWTLTGLWHGASWTFVVWGWLNFAIIVFSMQASPAYDWLKAKLHINDKRIFWRIFQVIRTVLLVSLLRIFYCSPTLGAAIDYIRMMFSSNWRLLFTSPVGVLTTAWAGTSVALKYILAGTLAIFIVDLVKESGKQFRIPMPVRMVVWGVLLCLLMVGGGHGDAAIGGFMYAQF